MENTVNVNNQEVNNMKVKNNYASEFYKKENKNYEGFFNKYSIDEEALTKAKKEVKRLLDELEVANNKYSSIMEKRYNSGLTMINQPIIVKYAKRNYPALCFDAETGAPITTIPENSYVIKIDTKKGEIYMIKGFVYSLGAVIIRRYTYLISAKNDRISFNLTKEYLVPIVDKDGYCITANNQGEVIYKEQFHYTLNVLSETLKNYVANQFIEEFYGLENYNCTLNLCELIQGFQNNPSMETLIRQTDGSNLSTLMSLGSDEFKPTIAQYLGLTKPEYKMVNDLGLMSKYIEFKINTTQSDLNQNSIWINLRDSKTMPEWIEYLTKVKAWEEDFKFYGISFEKDLATQLIKRYCGYSSYGYYQDRNKLISKNYTFGDFCAYVIEGSVNQGYTNVSYFIGELFDYLSMAERLAVKPTLNSSYLKQTHDIMSRNYQIKVDEEQSEVFKTRYEGFKPWVSKDKRFTLLAPKDVDDVKLEGSQMNNCVASYIKRIIDDTCRIYFFRATANPTDSYITVEYRDGAMAQVRRSHNRAPNDRDVDYLKECCEALNWKYRN